ncbi:MAG: TIGR02147 family protein [Bdellovibrionota bacterium]
MSPFEHVAYRPYLLALCERPDSRGLRKQLSTAAGCQFSYFSQALHGRVHLTEEHLAGIASFLRLKDQETEYLLLLLRTEKAGTPTLRATLEKQKTKLLTAQKSLKNRMSTGPSRLSEADLGLYFSSWVPSAVHLLTTDPAFGTADKIAERLKLPLAKITESLRFLERLGLVSHGKKGWAYVQNSNFFVPKDSPWQTTLQTTRRELAARSIILNPRDAVHFSLMFTISPQDLRKLEQLAADFVEKAQARVHASGTECLAAICLDVFEVV